MPDYTILIIDYEPARIEKLQGILQNAGYRVKTAADGNSGIESFNTVQPVMTFIEELLPRKTGLETCRELKATPLGARTPIIILGSPYRAKRARAEALGYYGGDDYLTKPVLEEVVLALVEKFVIPRPTPAPAVTSHSEVIENEIDERLEDLLGGLSFGKNDS
jgi:DNA-binding response OmpR family regulator